MPSQGAFPSPRLPTRTLGGSSLWWVDLICASSLRPLTQGWQWFPLRCLIRVASLPTVCIHSSSSPARPLPYIKFHFKYLQVGSLALFAPRMIPHIVLDISLMHHILSVGEFSEWFICLKKGGGGGDDTAYTVNLTPSILTIS